MSERHIPTAILIIEDGELSEKGKRKLQEFWSELHKSIIPPKLKEALKPIVHANMVFQGIDEIEDSQMVCVDTGGTTVTAAGCSVGDLRRIAEFVSSKPNPIPDCIAEPHEAMVDHLERVRKRRYVELRDLVDKVLVNVHYDITCGCPSCNDTHKSKYTAEGAEKLANAVNDFLDLEAFVHPIDGKWIPDRQVEKSETKRAPIAADRLAELREKYKRPPQVKLHMHYAEHGTESLCCDREVAMGMIADIRELLDEIDRLKLTDAQLDELREAFFERHKR